MKTNAKIPADIDAYIAGFPPAVQKLLQQVRATVKKNAPAATETIKYAMPTFVGNGNLVHFAGYEKHIGFYPVPEVLKKELTGYKMGKGSVQFPLDKPLPLELIAKIVHLQVEKDMR